MTNNVHVTYYAEHKDDAPETWVSPRPDFDVERFQSELTKIAGKINGFDRFRCRWAGALPEYILEEDLLIQTGWSVYENGESTFISCLNGDVEIPQTAIASPVWESHKVFTPRFVIEELREGVYHKCWFVESVRKIGEENGRIDVLSTYREPSAIDLRMVEHLRFLRDSLTAEDIEKGVLAQKMAEAAQKQNTRDEMVDEMAEDFARAITDGVEGAKPVKSYNNFNIRDYSKQVIAAHNG